MKKVYLAGKIGVFDWRHKIFTGIRSNFDSEYNDKYDFYGKTEKSKITKDGFEYAGPHFLRDDHGSFHGNGTHGRGVGKSSRELSSSEGRADKASQVVQKCFEWIDNSDYIFVWLDSSDAYGTIVEMGYAKALNKPIFFALDSKFAEDKFSKDIWFAKTMSRWFVYADDANEAWNIFLKAFKETAVEPFVSYIHDEKVLRNLRTKTSEYCNRLTMNKTADQINELDRDEIARDFINDKINQRMLSDIRITKRFHQDVMIELDYKLVRGFIKNNTNRPSSELKAWNIKGTGLVYKFEKNYEREENARESIADYVNSNQVMGIPEATEAQISYIETLLRRMKLQLNPIGLSSLDVESASLFISSLKESQEVTEQFKKYTIAQQFAYNKSDVTRQIKERINKPVNHQMHNYLIENFNATEDIKFSDGEYFNDAWIEFLVKMLKDDNEYDELKNITKKKE